MAHRLEKYVIQKRLAPTLFGDVLLCVHQPTGDLVAVKRVLLSAANAQLTLATNKKVRENVALERALYNEFNRHGGHPNVLQLRDEIEFDGYLYMVFDYLSGGELYEIVSSSEEGKLDVPVIKKYMNQIARGVQFMHTHGYAHRDLSLENVLVTDSDVCQVCDFGLAASATQMSSETVGKLLYMAPEVVVGSRYEPTKADIWSLGIMMFIMLIGAPPVEVAATKDARFRLIASKGVRQLIHRWGLTDELPPAAIDLLEGMLHVDPTKRFTMEMVISHPFLLTISPSPSIDLLPPMEIVDKSGVSISSVSSGASTSLVVAGKDTNRFADKIQRFLRRRSSKRVMAVSATPAPASKPPRSIARAA